ncbi:MAG: TatD family hydrolase [Sphingobacteriaceae bacterium]|nr:TatD family hydrolase [Sphingobacteriaceae bacterium]
MFINSHTHEQLYDATIELVNVSVYEKNLPKYFSYGIHPWNIKTDTYKDELFELERKVNEARCIAIGECGLDKLSDVDFKLQTLVFNEQIRIANKVKKPMIIHCVKAFNELINCLNLSDNSVPIIVHGFNNNENIARVLQTHGLLFSFGKALLGYESNASKIIKKVGRKNFLLETDNDDISIKYIYKKAAEILCIEEEILKMQIQSNFETIFKVKK